MAYVLNFADCTKIKQIYERYNLMSEKKITLSNIELVKLFGTNNNKLEKIKSLFPELKIISRGDDLKLIGSITQIKFFEKKSSTDNVACG